MDIRPVHVSDAVQIAAIYRPIVEGTAVSFELVPPTAEAMAERIEVMAGRNPWLVAEIGGTLAGYAYATEFRSRPAYSRTRETSVYVAECHRRAGVASMLMETLIARLAEGSTHLVVAGITLPNEASVALHESIGFSAVGVFREVGHKFDRWHDVGFWQLSLRTRVV